MQAFILTLVRHSATSLGSVLAANGYIAESDVNTLAGAALVLASAIWSYIEKRKAVK